MQKELLLSEIEDVIRSMPSRAEIYQVTPESEVWIGRAMACIEKWSLPHSVHSHSYGERLLGNTLPGSPNTALSKFIALLHQAQNDLRFETVGPLSIVVPHKGVFEYFDEVRKLVALATKDLLFVDPYLEADFVSRYLPLVPAGVKVRMLTGKKLSTLLPAVDLWVQQHGTLVEIRSALNLHDRYLFVDGVSCYQSGASFKDGGRLASTTLTQITDAFSAVLQTYEDIWRGAQALR